MLTPPTLLSLSSLATSIAGDLLAGKSVGAEARAADEGRLLGMCARLLADAHAVPAARPTVVAPAGADIPHANGVNGAHGKPVLAKPPVKTKPAAKVAATKPAAKKTPAKKAAAKPQAGQKISLTDLRPMVLGAVKLGLASRGEIALHLKARPDDVGLALSQLKAKGEIHSSGMNRYCRYGTTQAAADKAAENAKP